MLVGNGGGDPKNDRRLAGRALSEPRVTMALRQYARTDPEAVRAYVAGHRDRLSPLSVRGALKNPEP